MRPCSSTRISSARRTVARRCAMMIDVRPRSSRSSACSIRISVGRSMFDVASSRIRMRGSARSARAIEISWRSPAESPAPPSRTSCRSPRSKRRAMRSTPTACATSATSSSVASGWAKRMLSAIVPGEEERILEHDAELAAVRAQLELAQVAAVDADRAARRGRRSARRASPSSTCRRPTRRRARGSRRPAHGCRSRAAPGRGRRRT